MSESVFLILGEYYFHYFLFIYFLNFWFCFLWFSKVFFFDQMSATDQSYYTNGFFYLYVSLIRRRLIC